MSSKVHQSGVPTFGSLANDPKSISLNSSLYNIMFTHSNSPLYILTRKQKTEVVDF